MKRYMRILAVLSLIMAVPAVARAEAPRTVRLGIGQQEVLIDLLDNPAARAFAAQLPLTLPFREYAGTEKIATLPTRLRVEDSPSGRETPVDFAYFVPWGNLAVYSKGLGDDSQILALGRIRTGKAILAQQHGDFTATLELVQP